MINTITFKIFGSHSVNIIIIFLRNSGDSVERGQFRSGETRVPVVAAAAAGAVARAPDRRDAQHPGAVQMAPVLRRYQSNSRTRRLHTGGQGACFRHAGNLFHFQSNAT